MRTAIFLGSMFIANSINAMELNKLSESTLLCIVSSIVLFVCFTTDLFELYKKINK